MQLLQIKGHALHISTARCDCEIGLCKLKINWREKCKINSIKVKHTCMGSRNLRLFFLLYREQLTIAELIMKNCICV